MKTTLQSELQALGQRFTEQPRKFLPKNQAVWIFGAGQFGRDLCSALQRSG